MMPLTKIFFRHKNIILLVAIILLGIALYFIASTSEELSAGILPSGWDTPLKEVKEFIAPPEGNSVDIIRVLFWQNIVPIFKYLMVAVAIFYFILSLMRIIVAGGEEENIRSSQKNMLWGVLGFIIIAISIDIAQAFDIWRNGGQFVEKAILEDSQYRLVSYFQLIAGVIAFFYIFLAGFRMITAHGDEDVIEKQKNHIKWGFVGLIFVMFADVMVNRIFYPTNGERGLTNEEIRILTQEGVAGLKFFLTFTGTLAVISLVASGFVYINSFGDEGATEKAKKNLLGSLVAIIIIVSAFVLVNTFIPPGAPQS